MAIQNYLAMYLFLQSLITGIVNVSKWLTVLCQALAITLGGICSGMVNFFINLDLLKDFIKRFSANNKNNLKKLSAGEKFLLYAGNLVFIGTGLLFGLTTFTFGVTSPLAVVAIGAGILVSIIMIIQELETWWQSFDEELAAGQSRTLKGKLQHWKQSLTPQKMLGHMIAVGNVIALSALFALGLIQVCTMVGLALGPAIIIGFSVAFTIGAFTEFYFYNNFLADLCANLFDTVEQGKVVLIGKWTSMKQTKYAPLGFVVIGINAVVNAALTYIGVEFLIATLAVSAVPSLAIVIPIAVFCSVFSAAASFLLGMDFWIKRMQSDQQKNAAVAASVAAGATPKKERVLTADLALQPTSTGAVPSIEPPIHSASPITVTVLPLPSDVFPAKSSTDLPVM